MAIELTEDQTKGLTKLVHAEMDSNVSAGDEAYNTFWYGILIKLTPAL